MFPIFAPSFEMLARRIAQLEKLPPSVTIRPAEPGDFEGDFYDDPLNRFIAIATA